MPFKIAARTLLHLGAELISSDGVALYELVKNAFDARSKRVVIEIIRTLKELPEHLSMALLDENAVDTENVSDEVRQGILGLVDTTAPAVDKFSASLRTVEKMGSLRRLVRGANAIVIEDWGEGMSLADLNDVYLTIGTRSRLKEPRTKEQPVLGEKGLGRLAVMRLGTHVRVITSRPGEKHWNVLDIDWSIFSHASDAMLEEIEVQPYQGDRKAEPSLAGTRIEITALNETWTEQKLRDIAAGEISRLMDPFTKPRRFPVRLKFNDKKIEVPILDEEIFRRAHAAVEARLTVSGLRNRPQVQLVGNVRYQLRGKERAFTSSLPILAGTAKCTPSVLWSLGSWSMKAFWFNRKLLREEGADGREAADYVNEWSGGLMVFRDGFRVYPYGSKDDDWLDLDRKALASGGYKVNRKQLIGKVDISAVDNPGLNDQTNREGLRESPEKEALVNILKHILEVQFRGFLNRVDAEISPKLKVTFEVLAERVDRQGKNLRANLRLLRAKHPKLEEEMPQVFANLNSSVEALQKMMAEAQELADELESGHERLVHLAGLGLMVEMLAHELNRSTAHALGTLANAKPASSTATRGALETLEFQLHTLQKRLRTLDPATTSGRQRKQDFDLVALIRQIVEGHQAEFDRHGIGHMIELKPSGATMPVHLVKGMIIQIIENLIANATYWLKHRKLLDPTFDPHITFTIDIRDRRILVTDNGPGVDPESADDIFQPFYTTKPPGEGKGLGLYIARELAKYHHASVTIAETRTAHKDRLNTFVLTLPPA